MTVSTTDRRIENTIIMRQPGPPPTGRIWIRFTCRLPVVPLALLGAGRYPAAAAVTARRTPCRTDRSVERFRRGHVSFGDRFRSGTGFAAALAGTASAQVRLTPDLRGDGLSGEWRPPRCPTARSAAREKNVDDCSRSRSPASDGYTQ